MTDPARCPRLSRRQLMQGAAVIGAGMLAPRRVDAETTAKWAARMPEEFKPLNVPGKIVKVTATGDLKATMQPNQLFPRPEVAKKLVERALMEYTGATSPAEAMKKFIHPKDLVAIKVNGIGGQHGYSMATNYEVILPVVEAVLAVGVPPDHVVVYEQHTGFLNACRANVGKWKLPAGVRTDCHGKEKMGTPPIAIYQGVKSRFSKILTEATAVINLPLIKNHGICGYTGALKNMTHGNVDNPDAHHPHRASPQIALLYNQPVIKSRVRLHITDGMKLLFDGGPLDKNPRGRLLHGSIYVTTDPVAMDAIGAKLVDELRPQNGYPTFKAMKCEPDYIRVAAELGLGVAEIEKIRMKAIEV